MYPQQLFSCITPFARSNVVFVVMPFAPDFEPRWKTVLYPAISSVTANEGQLAPYRVDARSVSDPVATEILRHISSARLVLCDITAVEEYEGRWIRNGNVMYEVGLAHAVRHPQEVLLFRSDDEPLLFDIASVKVNTYDPDGNPEEAIQRVVATITDALHEIDLERSIVVQRSAESLDLIAWDLLASVEDYIEHPVIRTAEDFLSKIPMVNAITNMLWLGILRTEWIDVAPEEFARIRNEALEKVARYRVTPLGKAVQSFRLQRLRAVPELERGRLT
ncbi:MAG: hypothetical protein ACRD1T_17460 [Acidimicrobiia bacterium]